MEKWLVKTRAKAKAIVTNTGTAPGNTVSTRGKQFNTGISQQRGFTGEVFYYEK